MGDPKPPRPGMGALADQFAELRRDLARLKTPSGTQRADVTSGTAQLVDYLSARVVQGATPGPSWSVTVPGDGVERFYETGTALTFGSTGSAAVTASMEHVRLSLLGAGTASVSLRMGVREPSTGRTITGSSAGASARISTERTIGSSMIFYTSPQLPTGPVEVRVIVSVVCTVATTFDFAPAGLTVKPL